MKHGYLSQYFKGAAAKRLTGVEIKGVKSNQHEFNGDRNLRAVLGDCGDKVTFEAKFMYLNDDYPDPVTDTGWLTWYDARQKARIERGVNRKECRLYFPDTAVSSRASEGDLLILARMRNDSLLAIVAQGKSTAERQLSWLFGITDLADERFEVIDEKDSDKLKVEFAARFVLEQIGVTVENADERYLATMLGQFGSAFPSTREFSAFARSTLSEVTAHDAPDVVLLTWMQREEVLFRTMEKHLLGETLKRGFSSIDEFISISLSVQNRRKSRAGSALENHFEELLRARKLRYVRAAATEGRSRPDFLFPGLEHYRDEAFPLTSLTMLGVKSTCKDRWRQVLAEAKRIPQKHLLTLEPGISTHQTDEMREKNLQLILPAGLHDTFTNVQQKWLMNVGEFIDLVTKREASV